MGQEGDRGEEGKGVKQESLEAEYRALMRSADAHTVEIMRVIDRCQKVVTALEPYIEAYNRTRKFGFLRMQQMQRVGVGPTLPTWRNPSFGEEFRMPRYE